MRCRTFSSAQEKEKRAAGTPRGAEFSSPCLEKKSDEGERAANAASSGELATQSVAERREHAAESERGNGDCPADEYLRGPGVERRHLRWKLRQLDTDFDRARLANDVRDDEQHRDDEGNDVAGLEPTLHGAGGRGRRGSTSRFDACPDGGVETSVELRRLHLRTQRSFESCFDDFHDSVSETSPASAASFFRPRCNRALTVPVGIDKSSPTSSQLRSSR